MDLYNSQHISHCSLILSSQYNPILLCFFALPSLSALLYFPVLVHSSIFTPFAKPFSSTSLKPWIASNRPCFQSWANPLSCRDKDHCFLGLLSTFFPSCVSLFDLPFLLSAYVLQLREAFQCHCLVQFDSWAFAYILHKALVSPSSLQFFVYVLYIPYASSFLVDLHFYIFFHCLISFILLNFKKHAVKLKKKGILS